VARARLRVAVGLLWLLRIGAFVLLFAPIALVIAMSFGGDAYATYRYLDYDFKSSSKVQDLTIKGPLVGVAFRF